MSNTRQISHRASPLRSDFPKGADVRHVFNHNLGTRMPFVDVLVVDPETDGLKPFFPAMTVHLTENETVLHLPPANTYLVVIYNYDLRPYARWSQWVSKESLDKPLQEG